jgi:D-glycero-D-manno-heptose 1,7-bisphosphate phosphatase
MVHLRMVAESTSHDPGKRHRRLDRHRSNDAQDQIQEQLTAGIFGKENVVPGKEKAILCDLDGIFFRLVDHFGEYGVSARLEPEITVIDGLGKLLDEAVSLGYKIIGHTNQPDLSRGKITAEFLEKKHAMLREKYPQFAEIFFCAHTETDLCDCRKPKPGLLRQAGKKYDLDFSTCWVIGDSRGDIEAGTLVHAHTILVQTKYNCGNPAIDIATAVTKDTKGALALIVALEKGAKNKDDI